MILVVGHKIDGWFSRFPHVCPGENCAIERWLIVKASAFPVVEWVAHEIKAVDAVSEAQL